MTAPHPDCLHGVSYGPDDYDVDCCICGGNPCSAVTVAKMRDHREWDIDLWLSRAVTTGGGFDVEPPF